MGVGHWEAGRLCTGSATRLHPGASGASEATLGATKEVLGSIRFLAFNLEFLGFPILLLGFLRISYDLY